MAATVAMDQVSTEQILAQASQVRFSRVLATVIAGVFFALGWAVGRAWTGAVFCALAVRFGFREGTGRVVPLPAARPQSR